MFGNNNGNKNPAYRAYFVPTYTYAQRMQNQQYLSAPATTYRTTNYLLPPSNIQSVVPIPVTGGFYALNLFYQSGSQVSSDPNLSTQLFLTHIVNGEQDKAEMMLRQNPQLALLAGDITDPAKRIFKGITALQYALWSLDWHMWTMIKKYLPDEEAYNQYQAMNTAEWVARYGMHVNLDPLIAVMQKIRNITPFHWQVGQCNQMDPETLWATIDKMWVEELGKAQTLAPVSLVNEYCHPDFMLSERNFADPSLLPRTRSVKKYTTPFQISTFDWFASSAEHGALGTTFAVYRSHPDGVAPDGAIASETPAGHNPDSFHMLRMDQNAVVQFRETRIQQRNQFIESLNAKHISKLKY